MHTCGARVYLEALATSTDAGRTNVLWVTVGVNAVCDTSAGEVYRKESSPGQLSNLEACKTSCEGDTKCRSISYFTSGWCSHYSTACTKRRKGKATALTLTVHTKCPAGQHFKASGTSQPKCEVCTPGFFKASASGSACAGKCFSVIARCIYLVCLLVACLVLLLSIVLIVLVFNIYWK